MDGMECSVCLDGRGLTLDAVFDVAEGRAQVRLDDGARERIDACRELVEDYVRRGEVVYGITTGFGKFSDVLISPDQVEELQHNLIMSHASGVGSPLPDDVVRALMLLRANALARGNSGIRSLVIERLLEMINKGVHPVIPSQGSLGASGDLAPLAHMVLVLIGRGSARYRGRTLPGAEAMAEAGIETMALKAKEGLALINGTQAMTALGALAVKRVSLLAAAADICAALSFEALNGVVAALDHRVHQLRPHPGQVVAAANLRRLLEDSRMTSVPGQLRVQDAYALRCAPQVHGASRDALSYAASVIEREINSVTDNPLLFPEEGEVISGGNFHGQPVALALDFLGIAVSEWANISERRVERLVNPQLSGLPGFLTAHGGLNSGFMIAQYTAASLVSENKVLAHPASVDSIPSSANQEDHVSMGMTAARKLMQIVDNAYWVLAIELLAACQAIDLRLVQAALEHAPDEALGKGTAPAYEVLRRAVAPLAEDREMHLDIEKARGLLISGELVRAVCRLVELEPCPGRA